MLQELERRLVEVVEEATQSVVSVTTTTLGRDQLSRQVPVQGQGSGVILSESGFIVTNAHVIARARDVDVTLHDGRSFKAVVVGASKSRDLAILKIDAEGLNPIELGSSRDLKVGQLAIAVGNPLGLGNTVTLGMVSAIDRTIQGRETFLEDLIQTSAQINPGNSGGALIDTNGNLIGVPTAMIPWSQGIGFAIAVNSVIQVYEELMETGTIRTPWMGVVGVTVNKGIAAHYRLPIDTGALIVQVPKGPSAKAGLRAGDIIIAIDDNEVKSMEELRKKIMEHRVGEKMRVRFHRENDIFEAYVEIGIAP